MKVPAMHRDLSKEAFLWNFLNSPEFTDRSYERLKLLDRFITDLQETNPIGKEFAPTNYWVGVIRELLEYYPNARSMLEHEDFEAMERWAIKLGDIGRGFMESGRWMGIEDFKEILRLHDEAYSAVSKFKNAASMSIAYYRQALTGRGEFHPLKHDLGFTYADIILCLDEVDDFDSIQEFEAHPEITCKTGNIVPKSGVWVPASGMGTAALALTRQGQFMQPMYPVVDVDENGYEYVEPTDTEWYWVGPTGRMISLRTQDARVNRVPAGQPCPATGWWYTPAKLDSRRQFEAGEIFSDIKASDYGETLWIWSPDQN